MAEKRLTKEIAEQFLADEESVDLSDSTGFDDRVCGKHLESSYWEDS